MKINSDGTDCKVFFTAIANNKKSQKLIGRKVYTGKAVVKTNKGKYLYSLFANITRLTKQDAINDAIELFN